MCSVVTTVLASMLVSSPLVSVRSRLMDAELLPSCSTQLFIYTMAALSLVIERKLAARKRLVLRAEREGEGSGIRGA